MALANHLFCWNGLVTNSPEKTVAFLGEVLGWKSQEVDMGGEKSTMLSNAEGTQLAHIRPPAVEQEPNWWNNYIRVEDVDATVEAVKKNGGEVLIPATDIPPGRFSTIKTPTGAAFSVFKEARDYDDPKAGQVTWVDLHSTDIDKDLTFLKEAFGMTIGDMDMGEGKKYYLLNPDTKITQGGAMASEFPQAPSMWCAWVSVDSVDDTLKRVESNGGKVLAPAWDVPNVGRLSIVADPAGIVFGIMKPPAGEG